MFDFDGKPSSVSRLATALLESSDLPFDPEDPRSLACVVYRSDPSETWNASSEKFPLIYPFITAYAGISQIEPMFGPVVSDDSRRPEGPPSGTPNPLGFQSRENTQWQEVYDSDQSWRIYLNGRASRDDSAELIRLFKKQLLQPLATALAPSSRDLPLFPWLWHQERLARDRMVRAFQEEPPGADMDRVVEVLTRVLHQVVDGLLPQNVNRLGVYLNAGANWSLVWQSNTSHPLPVTVGGRIPDLPDGLNAFSWVNRSTRPVLLRSSISSVWHKRLAGCGNDILALTQKPGFAGICVVPLLDLYQQSRSTGAVFFASAGPQVIAPAHLFLLSRLALSTSSYVTPLFPFSGYPWSPDVDLGRGAIEVTWNAKASSKIPTSLIEKFARDLMPRKAKVGILPIQVGHSGAEVFKLDVLDEHGNNEIPRILKIGPFEGINRELLAYRKFVHNKNVGYASRVDIARVDRYDNDDWGALVYLLVGAGERAVQWSEWAVDEDRKALKVGLEKLYGQLSNWYENPRRVQSSPLELLITIPFVNKELASYIPDAKNPSLEEVKAMLAQFSRSGLAFPSHSRTSVVHGDLHAGNVFSLLGENSRLEGVAVIDWGNVSEVRHPLSDIAKLMADLYYKVRWGRIRKENREDEKRWAFEKVHDWRKRIGIRDQEDYDSNLALIHQIAKMLFYNSAVDEDRPYLSPDAREQAWLDLQDLVQIVQSRLSRSRKRA